MTKATKQTFEGYDGVVDEFNNPAAPQTTLNEKTFDLTEDERAIIADALGDWLDGRNDANSHKQMTKIGRSLYERMSNV